MHEGLRSMLDAYKCRSSADYFNALREIVQEIALLGLWRSKFFEYAAFYGGSALRLVYKLDRFSEDLDFSLLVPNSHFSLDTYLKAIAAELGAFGFRMTIESHEKKEATPIHSAFIKANTRINLLAIEAPDQIIRLLHREQLLKVKLEVDVDPPEAFQTEARIRILPIPYSVLAYSLPDLFAGKMSALLCRQWADHVKGRDWYDMVWCVARSVPLRINHLRERLVQQGAWPREKAFIESDLRDLIRKRIDILDLDSARADVIRFIPDPASVTLWSPSFFNEIASRIKAV